MAHRFRRSLERVGICSPYNDPPRVAIATRMTRKLLPMASVVGLVCVAPAGGAHNAPFRLAAPAVSKPRVVILAAKVQGRVAKIQVRTRGWRSGARWRIFVDGAYNNFSTNPRIGLALNLRPGTSSSALTTQHDPRNDVCGSFSPAGRSSLQLETSPAIPPTPPSTAVAARPRLATRQGR